MKYSFLLALLVASVSSKQAVAGEWKPVVVNVKGDRTFVELTSISKNNNIVWYWIMQQMAHPNPQDGLSVIQSYQSADCKSFKYRIRTERQFDALGQQIDYFIDGDRGELMQASPGQADYSIIKFVCRQ